jgi:hypothetical protein
MKRSGKRNWLNRRVWDLSMESTTRPMADFLLSPMTINHELIYFDYHFNIINNHLEKTFMLFSKVILASSSGSISLIAHTA